MPTLVKTNDMLRRLDVYLRSFDWQSLTPSKRSILQAFLRLSTKDGFSSVTMRNLANAVNLKPSSIYSHFPAGKDEILSVALRWNNNIYSMAVKEGLNSCTTPEQFWDALVSTHVSQQIMRPENDLWDLLMTTDRLGGDTAFKSSERNG
ncbi:TetR/AcrR family transcriptional regulator [Klebsiella variicola subsp. variicola]|nr:TetR/AcrR family transcriptional regulator [Klebsiella variicola subsp. variicola]